MIRKNLFLYLPRNDTNEKQSGASIIIFGIVITVAYTDLYQGVWENLPLCPDQYVISADEKTSIQAGHHRHTSLAPKPGEGQRVEFEYKRKGALCYIAGWDVPRRKLFGRCEARSGILSFDCLVQEVMEQEPYGCAERVFWMVDNGSSHRGAPAAHRLQEKWPSLVLVHLPIHASWLNQIEIYFSILQRIASHFFRFQVLVCPV